MSKWKIAVSVVGVLIIGGIVSSLVSQRYVLKSGWSLMSRDMYEHIQSRLPGEAESSVQQFASERVKMLELARQKGLYDDLDIQYAIDDLIILKLRQSGIELEDEAPPQATLKQYFKENEENYRTPEQRRVALIRLDTEAEGSNVSFEEGLEAFTESLKKKFNPGFGFGQLASRYSSHRQSRLRGGDIGWLGKDDQRDLPEAVNQVVWSIAEAGTLEKVETDKAVWYVLLSDFRPSLIPEYRMAEKRVKYDYFREQQKLVEEQWRQQWAKLPIYHIPEISISGGS